MKDELLQFLLVEMRSREKAERILEDGMEQLGIKTIEIEGPEKRRALAVYLKSELPYHSVARSNIIFSKLLNILSVETNERAQTRFNIDEKYNKVLEQKLMIEDFWKDVDKSLMKFEIIFNLFWLRAGEAEARGMTHDEVLDVTHKAMNAVKEELERSYEHLKRKFELEDDVFQFTKKARFISLRGDPQQQREIKEVDTYRTQLKQYIQGFWDVVTKDFGNFERIFFESLDHEVELQSKHQSDTAFVEEVRKKLAFLWADIEHGYEELKKQLAEFHEKVLAADEQKKKEAETSAPPAQ